MATNQQRIAALEVWKTTSEGRMTAAEARIAKLEKATVPAPTPTPVPPIVPKPLPVPGPLRGPNFSRLISNTTEYANPSAAKPAYLTPYTDPNFGTKITRISGTPGAAITGVSGAVWGDVVHHQYSKVSPWNCNETLFYIESNKEGSGTGPLFLDGETYAPLFESISPPSSAYDMTRWHPTNPDLMYYVAGAVFGTWNVRTGDKVTLRTFTGYSQLTFGQGEGNISRDGTTCVLDGIIGGTRKCFKYIISTDTKSADQTHSANNTNITPDGANIIYNDSPDVVTIKSPTGTTLVSIADNEISHFDVQNDASGVGYLVGRANGAGTPSSGLCRIRISDGVKSSLITSSYPAHTSARCNIPYAFCDYDDNRPSWQPYEDEITMAPMSGAGPVYRLCHCHNGLNGEYEAERHPCPSPSGGRVAFISAWDDAVDYRPAQQYVCDFR